MVNPGDLAARAKKSLTVIPAKPSGPRFLVQVRHALQQMNVKLAEVVSDISGLTGLAIIRASLAGERNPLNAPSRFLQLSSLGAHETLACPPVLVEDDQFGRALAGALGGPFQLRSADRQFGVPCLIHSCFAESINHHARCQ